MMVAAISGAASADSGRYFKIKTQEEPHCCTMASARKPKSREVPSRYLSPSPSTSTSSSSRRCASPLVSRATNGAHMSSAFSSVPNRSQSVDRRRSGRPTTPLPDSRAGNAGEVSAASKMLFTSLRSLSVSFQGEAFSLRVSKTKAAPQPNSSRKVTPQRRRATPLRGKIDGGGVDQVENLKPNDHRWPGRTRQANPLSVSLDCTGDKKKLVGSGVAVRALKQSMSGEGRRASFDGRLSLDLGSAEQLKGARPAPDSSSLPSDLTTSDTDSVSSGSTSGTHEWKGVKGGQSTPRGIAGSARFWQETNSRLRRLQDPGSQLSTSPVLRTGAPRRLMPSKKFPGEDPLSSPRTMSFPRAMASPVRPARPASPSKLATSLPFTPSRGTSPSRTRNEVVGSLGSNHYSSMPSILSFSVDVRRAKVGDNRFVDAHLLRLLYNQYLQWRFVNARADTATSVQRRNTEKSLWNASIAISDLRKSVRVKRIELQLLRQKVKLTAILRGQLRYLEEWALLDREHFTSLTGVIEALKAGTLRLPVVEGAAADIQSLRDAIGSAVNVMQAMASSICFHLSKVDEVNSLSTELVKVTAEEQAFLRHCKDFLSTLAAMQVKDCSLKAHKVQLNRVTTA